MKRRLAIALITSLSLALHSFAEDTPKTFTAGEYGFTVAKGWTKKTQARAMSAGGLTYKIEGSETTLDADFYHFGQGQGG